ncbi:hypothetical protein LCGC14_0238670 [marine sediment metagenome]|uniref:Uncharacterized protein n=1 Tax=marine sediment metagenome TaxID=412755 RepID=A0A0F9WSU8_9ZZZZ
MASDQSSTMLARIAHELKAHAPFTLGGTVVGIAILVAMVHGKTSPALSERLFAVFHPVHILLSAVVTAAMYRHYGKGGWWACMVVGYVGAIAVGTVSDSLIPFLGELLLQAGDQHVHPHAHIGFIELWWIVNPLALAGAGIGYLWPKTKFPHAGHVLLSTAASLFHMTAAMTHGIGVWTIVGASIFLFLAVWVPCCTSDIVFPLLLVPSHHRGGCEHPHAHDPGDA